MKLNLIYPRWKKLPGQTTFTLPPHGPVVFAATLPEEVEVSFTDENVEDLDMDEECDVVAISMMLTTQVKRGWAIADAYRAKGIPVMFGGISTMLHAEETLLHADSIFLGESEGRSAQVIEDLKNGKLKKVYNYMGNQPDIALVGPARRDLYKRELYNHKGVQMVDLFHASRGCRFSCYPCAVSYLGGRCFRPRPIDQTIADLETIDNNRLFIVDNSLAQNKQWESIFVGLLSICMYFIMHSMMISRIKEIGIYRAIGVSKKNLIFRSWIETLLLTTLTVFVGYILSSGMMWSWQTKSVILENYLYYPVWLGLIVLVFLYGISSLCGLIPILMLLRRTPSAILSKYDI